MDDWKPILEGPESNSPITEKFDPTWPYNFKWGYDPRTDRTDVWRVVGGTDGRPYHRKELEVLWGREPQVSTGDVLGLATYIPAERKLDGTVVAPPTVLLQAYYGKEIPQSVFDYFEQEFPGTVAQRAMLAPRKASEWTPDLDNDDPIIKWVWNQQDGVLIWQTDSDGLPTHAQSIARNWNRPESPKDVQGFATPVGGRIEMDCHKAGTPSVAFSAVKSELSKLYPDQEIVLPDSHDAAYDVEFVGSPEKLGGIGYHAARRKMRAAEWAQLTFEVASYVPPEAPVSAPDAVIGKADVVQPPLLVRGLRRVMGLPTIAASGADKDGAMVAVFLPEEAGEKIKVKGGEPVDDMHITLAYFVDKQADRDDWDDVVRIVEQIANQTPSLTGSIGGYGVFQNEVDILWAAPSVPGLAELRHKVVEACNEAGFAVSEDHGWAPHITLKYDFKGKLPRVDDKIEVDFDALSFARGGEHEHYDFTGAFEKQTDVQWKDAWTPNLGDWRGQHPETGEAMEYGPETWSGWKGAHRFVTDGIEVLTEPEEELRTPGYGWHGGGHQDLEQKFKNLYPDTKGYTRGWAIPTADDMGYGIHAPTVGFGGPDAPQLHDIVNTLDQHFGKPTHFIENRQHLSDADLYSMYPQGGYHVGLR